MTRRNSLLLMELCIMALVFALSSIFCIRMFAYAKQESLRLEVQDQAILQAQNAAELVKACAGDLEQVAVLWGGSVDGDGVWQIEWNAAWEISTDDPVYRLRVCLLPERLDGLGEAEVRVTDHAGRLLFALPVCWQKGGV